MDRSRELQQLLLTPKNVVIITHFKPDADALGSSLGLAGFLKLKGHRVTTITPSDYPSFLSWMPGNEEVLALSVDSAEPTKRAKEAIAKADILFCLDFSTPKRVEELEDSVRNTGAVKVLIDHHLEPEKFATFEQWTTKSASTAQLVFELIEEWNETNLISSDVANCLYAGLMTDTGNFRHNNTTEREFMAAARLTSLGANPSEVARQIYDTNSLERLRLTGYVLNEKLRVLPEFRTAYIVLSQDELRRFNSKTGDTEGLVNYGLSVKNVVLAVLMYERKSEIKLSFRSLGEFSVNDLARKHFAGGGHRNAAGGTFHGTLDETLSRFLELLPSYQHQLINT